MLSPPPNSSPLPLPSSPHKVEPALGATAVHPSSILSPTKQCSSTSLRPSRVSSRGSSLPQVPVCSDHVQLVYDAIAHEWHGTRYKAWPRVSEFVAQQPASSLIADLGCGNGKMHPACREAGHCAIGCDFSIELVRICALKLGMQAQAADVTMLPYRDEVFDAALSIAVLHHISTRERREQLIAETCRVLRPGGRALFYAWAKEQQTGRSGHSFPSADVFVPFHQRVDQISVNEQKRPREDSSAAAVEANVASQFDPNKRAIVYQRYCHVYSEGELRALVESTADFIVLDEYYDTGNWCVLATKKERMQPNSSSRMRC